MSMLSHVRTYLYLKRYITMHVTSKRELDFRYIRHATMIAIQLATKSFRKGNEH
jgi:hypothetical protein